MVFDIEEVNAMLKNYSEEWDEIYAETEKDMEELEGLDDLDDLDDENNAAGFDGGGYSEYERLKKIQIRAGLV